MTASFRFRTRSGRDILLVPEHAIRLLEGPHDGSRERALRDEPFGAVAIARARDDPWSTSREVLVIDLASRPPAGQPVWHTGEAPFNWDDVPFLGDLQPSGGATPEPAAPSVPRPVGPTPPVPRPADPSTVPVAPAEPAGAFVGFVVADQDGLAVRGRYQFDLDGAVQDGDLGHEIVRKEPVSTGAHASVTLWPIGYISPTRPGPPSAVEAQGDHVVDVASEVGPFPLDVGKTTRIVVRVPKATVFTLPAYALDLEVFRPGWLWFDAIASVGVSGLGCLAQMLAYAREHPARHVLVVGHTDTSGSKSHNRGVAERRAIHLAALLRADMEGWVASCEQHAELPDFAAHVQWAARRFGWPCEGGIVAESSPAFREATALWRERAADVAGIHVDPEAPVGADDWRIAYALLDVALAEELDLDFAALASLRTGLRWCAPAIVGAGELWPRELVGKNGTKSAVNRRTEVMFATVAEVPGGAGDPAGESLYGDDAWLWLDHVDPELRAALPLGLVSNDGYAVPATPFKIASEHGRVRHGSLGPQGETVVEDVAAGAFRVYWTAPDDVTAKIWAQRCETALRAQDAPLLRRFLGHAPALVQAVAVVWAERFAGGHPEALAAAIRSVVPGGDDAPALDFLLDGAGFPGRTRYEALPGDVTKGGLP